MYVTSTTTAGFSGTAGTGEEAVSLERRRDLPAHSDVVRALEHCPEAVGAARRVAQNFLKSWPVADADAMALVVSELVTNAVEHALPPLLLHLHGNATEQAVWVGVSDGGPAPHHGPWASSCAEEEHGRGLDIVEALTDAQETHILPDGRATHWARLTAA